MVTKIKYPRMKASKQVFMKLLNIYIFGNFEYFFKSHLPPEDDAKTLDQEFNEDLKNPIGNSLLLHKLEKQAFCKAFKTEISIPFF